MSEPRTIIVKLRGEPSRLGAPKRRIVRLMGPNLVNDARPLFPDEGEADLASLYVVTLNDSASMQEALATLNHASEVEYAHSPEERGARPFLRPF